MDLRWSVRFGRFLFVTDLPVFPQEQLDQWRSEIAQGSQELTRLSDEITTLQSQVAAIASRRDAFASLLAGAEAIERLKAGPLPLGQALTTMATNFVEAARTAGTIAASLFENGSATTNGTTIRGREAVRRVLQDAAPLTQTEIIDEVVRREWVDQDAKDPRASVRVTIRRLWIKDAAIWRDSDGRYWPVGRGSKETTQGNQLGAGETAE